MGADEIVAGIMLAAIVAAFVLDAVLPDERDDWLPPPGVPEASWSNVLGEDLPPMPVARVVDPPPLEWDVVTGEVVEPEPELIEPNIRRIGAGR